VLATLLTAERLRGPPFRSNICQSNVRYLSPAAPDRSRPTSDGLAFERMDLCVLGPLEVKSDSGKVVELGGRNQRAVFAVLLINRRTLVTRDRIIDAVWGEDLPSDPVNTVQHYVSRLRRVLKPAAAEPDGHLIQRLDDAYRLDVPADWVDADRFSDSLNAATQARRRGKAGEVDRLLALALATWRGEPFEDLTYFDFLQTEIRRLNEQRLEAFEELFDARLATGQHQDSLVEIADLARRNPLRERFWHQLMLALYRSGRQGEALRAYQEARNYLGRELGIEPSLHLADLEGQILVGDPDLQLPSTSTRLSSPRPPHRMPAPLTSFIGRREALQQLSRLLNQPRLVTIMGTNGIGKTRLAIEAARDATQKFDDGISFVSLETLSEPDAVAPAIAAAVGLPENPDRELIDTLVDYLAESRMLLLLDGCEQVAATCAELVARIQASGAPITILATSQVALAVEGETRLDLPPMRADTPSADATALFVERARQVRLDYDPPDHDRVTIGKICRTLDGNPLAIELAAARTDVLSIEQIETELADGFGLAAQTPLPGSIRHRTLGTAIEWSLRLLTDRERHSLDALSTFSRDFDIAAAQAIAFPTQSMPEVTTILTALAAKSFLRVERPPEQNPRFSIPHAVQGLCSQQLRNRDRGYSDQLSARHASWYAALAEGSDIELRGPDHRRWLRAVQADESNLRAAMTWALERNDAGLLDRLVGHLARYWDWTGRIADATAWIDLALNLGPGNDSVDRGWVLTWAAYFTAESGDLTRGERFARDAIAIADKQHQTDQQAAARGNLGIIYRYGGRLPEAVRRGQEALEIASAAGDDWFHAWAATALATTHLRTSETRAARGLGKTSLEIFRRLGDQGGEAWSLNILAIVALTDDDLASAGDLARNALLYAHPLGAHHTLIWTLEVLAQIAHRSQAPSDAAQLLSAADSLRRSTPSARPANLDGAAAEIVAQLRSELTTEEFATAWQEGGTLNLEDILSPKGGCEVN
jgi:predicted ATPase/DNA-binding SARP family transcriptional activator